MNKLLLTIAGLGLTSSLVLAQTQAVRGVVVDAATGETVIGASVLVKGHSGVGVATDIDGKFTLNVPKGASHLVISYIGYKTVEVAIKPSMTIKLASDSEQLDDVVIIGYGTQKKASFVGSQATVGAKNLAKRPISNATSALAGLTPGVQLTTSNGQPGASENIVIRGSGSINAGANPVYVVDGTIYNGAIGDIAPSDIQSIDILKDAASTAIYGSSAGNGVVLITTKSGSYTGNSKPTFTFTMNQGFSERGMPEYNKLGAREHYTTRWQQWYNSYVYGPNFEKWFNSNAQEAGAQAAMDVYSDLKYNPFSGIKSYYNADNYSISTTKSAFPVIVMPDGTLNKEITGLSYADDLDWESALFRTGHRHEYNFSGAFNNDKLKSYFSIGYLGEKGYRVNTDFSRFNGRANLSYNFTKWLEMGTNISYTRSQSVSPKILGAYNSNSFSFIQNIAPIYPIHRHDEAGNYILENGEKLYDYRDPKYSSLERPYRSNFNPVYESLVDRNQQDRSLLSTRSFVTIKPMKGLSLKANLAYDATNSKRRLRYNNILGDQPQGMLKMTPITLETFTFNQLVDYNKSFGVHNLSVLLGHEHYDYTDETVELTKEIAAVGGIDEYSAYLKASELNSYTDTYRKESYFGRINYDYDARYNLSFSYRRDGSSRFARPVRWGNFWSVGAGWNAHREQFLKDVKWINSLKLRASIGQTGNDDLRKLSDSDLAAYYPDRNIYGIGAGKSNYTSPGLYLDQVGTPELLWESQTNSDIAVEARLFNRLQVTLEFFNKSSRNLLFALPRPLSSGIENTAANLGQVRNYGFEFDLKYAILEKKDLHWDVSLNGTFLKNKIVRLPDANRADGIEVSDRLQKYEEGHSVYEFFTREYVGVNPENGLSIYRLDSKTYPDAKSINEGDLKGFTYNSDYALKHFAGSSIPSLQGGFGSNLTVGSFDVAINFIYQLGGKVYDSSYAGLMSSSLNSGQALHVDALNAWRKPGDKTNVPRFDAGTEGTQWNNASSDRFITSSDALMLKSLSVGYTLPKKWLASLGISSARISIAGENLFLVSARKGLNPFRSLSGYSSAAGYDYSRTLTTSLSITL